MSPRKRLKNHIIVSIVLLFSIITLISMIAGVKLFAQATGQGPPSAVLTPEKAGMARYAFIAAAIAFGLGAMGAGIAIGNVGAAAMGAVAEKPEVAGQALIFVALAEGLVIFGFITALMILGKV